MFSAGVARDEDRSGPGVAVLIARQFVKSESTLQGHESVGLCLG